MEFPFSKLCPSYCHSCLVGSYCYKNVGILVCKRVCYVSLCWCKMVYRIVLQLASNFSLCPCYHVPFVLLLPKRCTFPVQSHLVDMSVQSLSVLTIVFISLCHQQLDHFCEEEEKDSNWCRILDHMICLLYPSPLGTFRERMNTTRIPSVLWS